MKSYSIMIGLLLVATGLTELNARSFGEALKRKEIKYEVVSVPGPRRMLLRIKNLLKREARIDVEPGRFFYNTSAVQPFVVSRPIALEMEPGEEREVAVRAYCGNATAACPSTNQDFTRTELGPENLCATLQMMAKNQIVGEGLYQQVIWFYSNKHQIASVFSGDADENSIQLVRQFICKKEDLKLPQYHLKYAQASSGDELEFSGRPDEVFGKLNIKIEQRSDLQIRVLDAGGNQIQLLQVHLNQPAGEFEFPVLVSVTDYPLGEYTIAVCDERGNVLSSMPVVVS